MPLLSQQHTMEMEMGILLGILVQQQHGSGDNVTINHDINVDGNVMVHLTSYRK